MTTRRQFVRQGIGGAAGLALPLWLPIGRWQPARRDWTSAFGSVGPGAGDPALAEVGAKALDAARAAGATYADVRFTLTRLESVRVKQDKASGVSRTLRLEVGVRTLVDGVWGFRGGVEWGSDAVVAYAREAARAARQNVFGVPRRVELAACPPVPDGHWAMPVERDPFEVPIDEKVAYLREMHAAALAVPGIVGVSTETCWQRQEKTFLSTDGSVTAQRVYDSLCADPQGNEKSEGFVRTRRYKREFNYFRNQGRGFEALTESGYRERIVQFAQEAIAAEDAHPIDPGRYDLVLDAEAMSALLDASIGEAAQLDRALGYEANDAGTSYLAPPATVLGQFALGPDWLTVTCDRSQPGSAARVAWDEEGVVPESFTLIDRGRFVDYPTMREQAAWLSTMRSASSAVPARSRGCAAAENAAGIQRQFSPNLAIRAASHEASFEDLVAATERGIAFIGGSVQPDQQLLNGMGLPDMAYAIRRGKLAGVVSNAAYLFRTPEHWRSLQAVGGPASYRLFGRDTSKGNPAQTVPHGVGAVPAKFANVRVVNTATRSGAV